MPVHNVGHIVVAHFCQFEDILDDKPAHGGDDDADYNDERGGDGGDHDESIVESAEFVQFFFLHQFVFPNCQTHLLSQKYCPLSEVDDEGDHDYDYDWWECAGQPLSSSSL